MFKIHFYIDIPRATQGSSAQIPGWIWVYLPSKVQNKPDFLDRPELKYEKSDRERERERSESERKEKSWETEVSCKIHESASFLCWERHLSLEFEKKEFYLMNIKKPFHIILPLAQNCSRSLNYSKQTEMQQAKVRNTPVPLRRAQALSQLKEVNSGYLNSELKIFSLHLNFHLFDVMHREAPCWNKSLNQEPGIKKESSQYNTKTLKHIGCCYKSIITVLYCWGHFSNNSPWFPIYYCKPFQRKGHFAL